MSKVSRLLAVVLILGLACAIPVFAETAETVPVPTMTETPAQPDASEAPGISPEVEAFIASLNGERVNQIRTCTEQEEQQCGVGCACVVISNQVKCFC
jgi:hypothetical protein